jgi:hypothetical protein
LLNSLRASRAKLVDLLGLGLVIGVRGGVARLVVVEPGLGIGDETDPRRLPEQILAT